MTEAASRSNKVCFEIMRYLVEQGFTKQVHMREVEKAIVYLRGPDARTLNNWKRALTTLGYLERASPHVFNMNLARCAELLTLALRGEKQKKLM